MNQNVTTTERPRRSDLSIQDPIPLFDSAKFEMMQRVASAMAYGSLVPESLTHIKVKGQPDPIALPHERVLANCFLVVNQAARWGMDPFAVAQCVSVVHGKLCYEGKLIAAVLEAKLGIDLDYKISGDGDAMQVVVTGIKDGKAVLGLDGLPKTVTGTVGEWKTTGNGSPWGAPGGKPRMLRYRGAREWSRTYEPGIMLGVYSEDEMMDLADDARARRATPVRPGLAARLAAAPTSPSQGFNAGSIDAEINGDMINSDTGEITNSEPAASSGQVNQGGAAQENDKSQPVSTGTGSGLNAGKGDANSPTQSDIAADQPVPTSPVGNDESSAERGADQGGDAPPSVTAASFPYGDYARALARASQEKSLLAFDRQFREKAAWTTEDACLQTLRDIYALHRKKLRGEIKPHEFVAELTKLGAT